MANENTLFNLSSFFLQHPHDKDEGLLLFFPFACIKKLIKNKCGEFTWQNHRKINHQE